MIHNIDHNKAGKHCHNCASFEWGEGDTGDPSGWVCNARDYETIEQETIHLNQLGNENYRFKGKRCFTPK